jgi:acetoin utilization protein AcuB
MRLEELMTKDVKTCHPAEPVSEAQARMRLHHFHHLVVAEGTRVLGVLSERDLRGAPRRDAVVGDVMTTSVVTADPHTTVREAANLLRGRSIGCLPVMKGSRLVGIVTVTDLLELVGKGTTSPGPRVKPTRRTARTPRFKRS